MLIEKKGDDGIMAVGEHVGLDPDLVAERALDGEAPAIDLRADRFDDRPGRRSFGARCRLMQA